MHQVGTNLAAAATVALTLAGLTACSGGGNTAAPTPASASPKAPASAGPASGSASGADVASVNPCTLLTDAEVATIAPGVGHGKVHEIAGVAKICDWPNSHDLPEVQLQVNLPPPSSIESELKSGLDANGGYTIVTLNGLGDEAAAAFQKADPAKGLTAGLATIIARSGNKVVQLSTPLVTIKQGSATFAKAEGLVAKAISRL